MKKLIAILIVFVVISFFVIEFKTEEKEKPTSPVSKITEKPTEKRAIFISYIELEKYIRNKDIKTSQNNILKILDNLEKNNFNMAIVHVRAFSDAIYKSNIFPASKYILDKEGNELEYDILSFFISEAHKRKIEFHAWINPYRIRNTTDLSDISPKNPALEFIENGDAAVIKGKGIFYNPASEKVKELVISGVEEIVSNYDVDGIHFDDYFYPNDTIDFEDYQEYLNKGGSMSVQDFRLNNTSLLIKEVYDKIKSIKKDVVFGISPEGNINNNYDTNYIDTKKLLKNEGYIDYIMPQLYFGFDNEICPFLETASMWNSLIEVKSIELIPALALYKAGSYDKYAKAGQEEWILKNDIIKSQLEVSRKLNKYSGFSIFRYDYMFSDEYSNDNLVVEVANLVEEIKK